MNEHNVAETRPKFTRGEKCIFVHLVLTIAVIIVLLIIYLAHILVVEHIGSTSVFDSRRSLPASVTYDNGVHKLPIGLLIVNLKPVRNMCNTLLLTRDWSISAGHCVAMRSDRALSYLVHSWMIKYPYNNEGIKIIRDVVHPNFSRDTFSFNVGLIQHNPVARIHGYRIPKLNTHNINYGDDKRNKMKIISWSHSLQADENQIEVHNVRSLTMQNCTSYVSPIIELRNYEFCIVLKKKTNLTVGHGAVILDPKDITVYGIFTWGESEQVALPIVVLNLSHFKEWFNSVTVYSPLHG